MACISIIVPVYNAETYLARCIESILQQTFPDFELLLIDDGSKDRSLIICNEYKKNDNRIRVFHKENGGVSSAREYGLNRIKGCYVIHIDPDDWIESNMLEVMYTKAVKDDADMVICDYWLDLNHRVKYMTQNPIGLTAQNVQNKIFRQELYGSLWNKLIKTNIIREFNIHFPPNINLWEDAFFVCSILCHDIKISYLNMAFYHYDMCINNNSLVRNLSRNSIENQLYFVNYFEQQKVDNKSLFVTKCVIIETAFYQNVFSCDEVCMMFLNFNKEYLKSHIMSKLALCQCLKGHYKMASVFRYFHGKRENILNIMKRLVRNILSIFRCIK